MSRYQRIDKTGIADVLIPPRTSSVKIRDTKTGEEATGTGFTKKQAEKNAWDKLKNKK